ncbi:chemotaxis-specific protein-glutamate methyltransferase CheB [Polaromonas sp. JS666]|uniref:chemotaxis-specific protein-glutamate methyltransferase CheB n=1 Tax=Polaromonas sp. (strain JS666 / ATCC BAA-500) TaxID=296591 RepID=UPI0000464109|nr:chemotaxis-specific protein-glutamate methyltransferase CheB [Polaromonas sp. JS666]ABE44386.1 response regulator receiver (CheY-like) modulated CheB methylesterase [Polaromonas sp. JS666]
MTDGKINVLVAEDSAIARVLLVRLLESDPLIRVVGAVGDGQAAIDFVNHNKPDVVLMGVHMPRLDGFETTRRIMETQAVPIIICSASNNVTDIAVTFRAMEAGAIACIEKPFTGEQDDFEAMAAHLLETVKLMSEVKVVRRTAHRRPAPLPSAYPPAPAAQRQRAPAQIKLVGIGASTGGPLALQTILSGLPKDFPAPVLVVQHIAHGFLPGMAEWLNQTTTLQIHIASYGTTPLPGHVYLAPDDFHMGIGTGGNIILTREAPENHLRPAVSFLFRSLAETYGPNALGVLLTGMGKDGAEELKAMMAKGAVTIAQDQESSVVHGMPGVAIALGAATQVLPADKIADALIALVRQIDGDGDGHGHGIAGD